MPAQKNANPASTKTGKTATKATAKAKAPEKAPKAARPARGHPNPSPKSPTAGKQDGQILAGVRPMRTRPYHAGVIVAKHCLAAGITPAMVAELDKAYGRANPRESRFCLKNAYHAARG